MTNILECFLYHRSAAEACEETLVELIDYCYRKFIRITGKYENTPEEKRNKVESKDLKELLDDDPIKELDR
jgi:hypothetical protein